MSITKYYGWQIIDLDVAPGGAQRSDKIIIDQGKLLGYNIFKT